MSNIKIRSCPERGDQFVILVKSPSWPPGEILQFIVRESWYGHFPIEEFEKECQAEGCTILHMERVEDRPGDKYLSAEEIKRLPLARIS